jgi:transcriptional regulator GlxA family with amidase domain
MRLRLEEDPGRPATLRDVADVAGVSGKHLCRLFRKHLGYSPMQTYRLLQMQVALGLLTRSNLTVKQIAAHCGFANQFYFSRCFSKCFGRPPSRVRSDLRAGQPPPLVPLPVDLTPRVHW